MDIESGGHAIGEIGQKTVVHDVQHAAAYLEPMGVGVDEPWNDRRAAHIDGVSTRGNVHLPAGSDGHDAIVADHDVRIGNHLVAIHRDDVAAA